MQNLAFSKLFPRFFTGWCLAALVETLLNPYGFDTVAFIGAVSVWRFLLILTAVTCLLTVAAHYRENAVWETRILVGVTFSYLFVLALREHRFWFSLALALVMLFVAIYALPQDRLGLRGWSPSCRQIFGMMAAAAGVFTVFTATVTVCRYYGHYNSTFDFGIFAQMFHYMKTTGLPLTTCERGTLLSHFAVHASPILYLLLPGYCLFSSPVYLQIMQALVLASGIIPLYLLAKERGLSQKTRLAVCLLFCTFPALAGGCFYDFHENCFLTPLLLWLFYFYEKKRSLPLLVFAVLTLLVKEDAAIYVAAFSLYLLCGRRDYKRGGGLLALSTVYFLVVTALLSRFGEGTMTVSRFEKYMPSGSGSMLTVAKTVFLNPAYLFEQVFTVEKLPFLLLMMLPLLFLPLYSKKLSQLILLIPMLVVNVMPNWQYQYSTHFQYVFGSIALLFYLTVLNVREIRPKQRHFLLPLAVALSVLLATADLSGYVRTVTGCFSARETNRVIDTALETIPADASVKCNGYYLPALADRDILYDFRTDADAEYIVLDLRPNKEDNAEAQALYRADAARYTCLVYEQDIIAIYRDTAYTAP